VAHSRKRGGRVYANIFLQQSWFYWCKCLKGHSEDKELFASERNKHFLIWLLTIPPRLKYVATLPCKLSLIACFLTFTFQNKVVWQHMQGVVGSLITTSVQINQGIFR